MGRRDVPVWLEDIFGAFNLIDWVMGILWGLYYGDVTPHRISIPHPDDDFWEKYEGAFWNLRDTMMLLKEYHVRYYWIGFNGKEIWLHVQNKQARWAEYICLRAGIPIQTIYDYRNTKWAAGHGGPPPSWRSQREAERRARRKAGGLGYLLKRWFR